MKYAMEKIIATNIITTVVEKVKEQLPNDAELNFKNVIDDYAKLIYMQSLVAGICILREDFLKNLDTLDTNNHVIYGFDFENNKIGKQLPMDKDALIAMGDEAKFLVWYPS